MKKLFILGLVLMMMFTVSVVSLAANPVQVSADIYAEVLEAIEVTKAEGGDLIFGTPAAPNTGATGGTVIVTPDSSTSTTNIPYHDGIVNAAQFNVQGSSDVNYSVNLPTDDITLTDTVNPSNTMTVNTFTSDLNGGETIGTKSTFYVGGTLNVGVGQPAGSYQGSFEVTVTFD